MKKQRKRKRKFLVTLTIVKTVTKSVLAHSESRAEKQAKDDLMSKPPKIARKDIDKFPQVIDVTR